MSVLFTIFQICFVYNIKEAYSEEINLYGDAGQAYSVEAYLGHPHQKVRTKNGFFILFLLLLQTGKDAHQTNLAYIQYQKQSKLSFMMWYLIKNILSLDIHGHAPELSVRQ